MPSFVKKHLAIKLLDKMKRKRVSSELLTLPGLFGAEGETRTPTSLRTLDPEPSVSTNSTTSALKRGQFIANGDSQCKKKTGF